VNFPTKTAGINLLGTLGNPGLLNLGQSFPDRNNPCLKKLKGREHQSAFFRVFPSFMVGDGCREFLHPGIQTYHDGTDTKKNPVPWTTAVPEFDLDIVR
jgi:hypothetical protein